MSFWSQAVVASAVAFPVLGPVDKQPPNPSDVVAGWVGGVVVAALVVAVVLLLFSFRRHLKRVNFDEAPPEQTSDRGSSDGPERQAGDRPGHPPRG